MNLPTQIELRSVRALLPHVRNSRTHSDEQVAQVAGSIREFGWTNPILIDSEDVVIAGHARLPAARKLGMAEVPVIVLAHLTPAQKRALIIADNKLALNAGWDEDMLRAEVAALQEDGFDLERKESGIFDLDAVIEHSDTDRSTLLGIIRMNDGIHERLPDCNHRNRPAILPAQALNDRFASQVLLGKRDCFVCGLRQERPDFH
jgi:hypothetical protein